MTAADPLADQLRYVPAWRVVALAAGTVLMVLLVIVILTTVAAATVRFSPLSGPLHQAAVGLPIVLGVYWAAARVALRAPPAWFLAGRPDRGLVRWASFGLLFPAGVLGVQLAVLNVTWLGDLPPMTVVGGYVLASVGAGLLAGVLEELAFRGVLLRLIEARWGGVPALWVTAMAFALLHQGHAATRTELGLVLASMLAAGLLLGTVAIRTRSVWNAVAVHAGWNTVFGGRLVSVAPPGGPLEPAVVQARLEHTSPLLTGGDATLGASPVTMVLVLGAAAGIARYGRTGRPSAGPATGPTTGADR